MIIVVVIIIIIIIIIVKIIIIPSCPDCGTRSTNWTAVSLNPSVPPVPFHLHVKKYALLYAY